MAWRPHLTLHLQSDRERERDPGSVDVTGVLTGVSRPHPRQSQDPGVQRLRVDRHPPAGHEHLVAEGESRGEDGDGGGPGPGHGVSVRAVAQYRAPRDERAINLQI